ncbi:mitogen activated protein kinase kinase kinase [Echinococcus multilocularis]|uniref:Mitogen activated protein kinase kinase kinase n=1 Tax=Echinococcus multilocularis TaxID=6211 RepID=A0A068Y3K8_ECHMU|nr:mitogen activated protein kinase kinase kinase 1 [Echinococcus multilocularis]CDS36734.1 mitogen activated protein kinase kinase kinase [Echinococcus multilocularis]
MAGAGATGCSSTTPKRQRFRVTLGGHSSGCSCSEQPFFCPASTRSPCAHTLFVLLRILRLRLEDPRISRPRLENYEVEPLLQRYARLRASNFRLPGGHHPTEVPTSTSTSTTVTNPVQNTQPTARIVMPRPVVLNTSAPNTCLLAAVRASVGSSECSELSNITRSIEPSSRGCEVVSVCRRCLSHASSTGGGGIGCRSGDSGGGVSSGGGGGGRVGNGVGGGERGGSVEVEDGEGFERRPKTEPQAYYDTLNSRISILNSATARHALSTTFRPIGEPSSNPETDPETEGVSSSSRSSRFEETPSQGVIMVALTRNVASVDDTLTGQSRRSASPDAITVEMGTVCRLCLRELRPLSEPSTTVCSSVDCGVAFHQECFCIWQEECESETGSLYCPVCGRVWTNALTPTNLPEGGTRRVPPSAADLPAPPPPHEVIPAWAPVSGVENANLLLLQNQIIPGLRSSLAVWKSVFSEEVAMGMISPYWHVRQSALRQVAKITICRVLMARKATTMATTASPYQQQSEGPSTTPNNLGCESLRMSIRLIQYLLSDPADEVFIASLCAFREILGYLICLDTETMTALQRTIAPVLRRLLIFVGGYLTPGHVPINNVANLNLPTATASTAATVTENGAASIDVTLPPPPDQHRRANLALVTLVELAKGQEGEMSIGRDTSNAEECMSISGLPHMAHFLLRSAKFHQTHLVGRLKLLEKLVEMHRETVAKISAGDGVGDAVVTKDVDNKRISYRHLCSSLIFTRRHVYPPEQPVFPHNLVSEDAMATRFRRNPAAFTNVTGSPLKVMGVPGKRAEEVQISSFACLMEANIKASRLARRVFITVARALLQEPRSSSFSSSNGSSLPDAESFVSAEIKLLDVSLAAKLRAKLADLLNTNTTTTSSSAATITASNPISASGTVTATTTTVSTNITAVSTTTPPQPPPPPEHEVPPVPPPRRFSQSKTPARAPSNSTRIITPNGVRVALEPAYDHVALSETAGVYSSSEDEEDGEGGDEEPLEKLDWEEVRTTQQPQQHQYQGKREPVKYTTSASVPVTPSPAELSALKTALRRAAWSPVPLVTIPNLAQALDAKDPLKSEYRYKEGVDWLLGPFLGKGAFSLCYQARDIRTGTLMAVKRLRFVGDSSAEAMEQLATAREEVEIMRRLYHPNVLRLFGIAYNPEKKHVDIFVEWMPGGSITSLLNQYGAFTEPVSLAYTLQVVRGISCLHKHGILHRDLKGANLLVDCTGSVVRISDFGASARLGSQGSVAGQFQGQVIGTFAFMAPEVLRGETYGRACDIWSVGCCLLEMLSGKPPWNDSRLTNQYALMFTIASTDQPPSYPKSVSSSVKQFLDSCFNRIPEQRPTAHRLLQHPVFSAIVSAPEPSTKASCTSKTANSSLSKSFTAVSLSSSSSSRATSRHRALPPVPHESSLPPTTLSPLTNYDKLVSPVPTTRQQQQQQHQVVPLQRKICRNQ